MLALTCQTAALELAKGEYIELAPLPGVCGPFKLFGNSLPVIEYRVFDPRKKPFMMEFIKVRVEISKPDRIQYFASVDSKGSVDAARHGEEVPVLDKYREPFEKLAIYLFNYFPYWRNPQDLREDDVVYNLGETEVLLGNDDISYRLAPGACFDLKHLNLSRKRRDRPKSD